VQQLRKSALSFCGVSKKKENDTKTKPPKKDKKTNTKNPIDI